MHLYSFDYLADAPAPEIGLEALSATIAELRTAALAEDPPRHTLLVDNGDLLQGTALADLLAENTQDKMPHPLAQVMNALGYDAVGLGNHDFDYGLDYLEQVYSQVDAPVLCANLTGPTTEDWLRPHTCLDVAGLKIGIFSLVPPSSLRGLGPQISTQLRLTDIVPAAQSAADTLLAEGADILIALAHSGIANGQPDNALDVIARDLPLAALIGGHTHNVFPGQDHADHPEADIARGTLHGVPTVMPGFAAALLGCIDLDLECDRESQEWRVAKSSALVVPPRPGAAGIPPEFEQLRPWHNKTRAKLGRIVGQVDTTLHSYFAQVQPCAVQALSAAAQSAVIEAARIGTEWENLPLLSATSLTRVGGSAGPWNYTDIPAGPVLDRHVAEMNAYANLVCAVPVSGAGLLEWLEKSASGFARVGGDWTGGLWKADFPSFDFDVIHGVSYQIDPTRPARFDRAGLIRGTEAHRISALWYRDRPVAPADRFLVAVNSYRACGGGQFPGLTPDRAGLRTETSTACALLDYLQAGARPAFETPWQFAPACTGVPTWFETGPGAVSHLSQIAHLHPGTPQLRSSGFVRIPITLGPRA